MSQSPVSCSRTTSPAATAGGPGSVGRVPCAHQAELIHIPSRSAFWDFAKVGTPDLGEWCGDGARHIEDTAPSAGTAKAGAGSGEE